MDLILKATLGAAVVVILAALAKTRNYYIAGLVPLFPTFALIAHYIVGKGPQLSCSISRSSHRGWRKLLDLSPYRPAICVTSCRCACR